MAKKFGFECGGLDDIFPEGYAELSSLIAKKTSPRVAGYMGNVVCLQVRTPDRATYGKLVGQVAGLGFSGFANMFPDGRLVSVWRMPADFREEYGVPELEFVEARPGAAVAVGPVAIHYRIENGDNKGLLAAVMAQGDSMDVLTVHNMQFSTLAIKSDQYPDGISARFRVGHTPLDIAYASAKSLVENA